MRWLNQHVMLSNGTRAHWSKAACQPQGKWCLTALHALVTSRMCEWHPVGLGPDTGTKMQGGHRRRSRREVLDSAGFSSMHDGQPAAQCPARVSVAAFTPVGGCCAAPAPVKTARTTAERTGMAAMMLGELS